jgi:arginase
MGAFKMAVLGVPSAAGARSEGVARGAAALREAGLLEALASLGARVVNLSDLSLFPYREDPDHPHARNAATVRCAIEAVADEMGRALREGFTLVLGGDCTLAAGVAAGMKRALQGPVGLVYIDANADLNTPETSPSGFLNGMALSLALGDGPRELLEACGGEPPVRPREAVLLGYRETDPGEIPRLASLGAAIAASEVRREGMAGTVARALEVFPAGVPILVHLDVDAIDPREMPSKDSLTPGPGLTFAEAEALLEGLVRSPRVAALYLAEFHPGKDPDGAVAARLVGLLSSALRPRIAAGPGTRG